MKVRLEKNDRVKMLPAPELFDILKSRNFCYDDATRQKIADEIGGKNGVVQKIEDKYAFDYFYFLPDGNESHQNYSMPYESVKF